MLVTSKNFGINHIFNDLANIKFNSVLKNTIFLNKLR